jgi:translation initiation factor 4E
MDGDSIKYEQGSKNVEESLSFSNLKSMYESAIFYDHKEKAKAKRGLNSLAAEYVPVATSDDGAAREINHSTTYLANTNGNQLHQRGIMIDGVFCFADPNYPVNSEFGSKTPDHNNSVRFPPGLCGSLSYAAAAAGTPCFGSNNSSKSVSRRSSPSDNSYGSSLADSGIISGSYDSSRGSPQWPNMDAAGVNASCANTFESTVGGDYLRDSFVDDNDGLISGINRLNIVESADNSGTDDDEIYYSDDEDFFQQDEGVKDSLIKLGSNNDKHSVADSLESNYYSAENNDTRDDNEFIEDEEIDQLNVETFTDLTFTTVDHKLKHEYCFWYWRRRNRFLDYSSQIKLVTTFQSIEEFWGAYSHLVRPDSLSQNWMKSGLDLHVFRKGIRPVWEDEENKGGGKWMVRLPKGKSALYWENLILAMLGDQFLAASQYICGVVVSIRYKEEILALWIKSTGGDTAINNYICDIFKKVLQMSGKYEGNVFEYKAHQDSLKDDSSFQNTDVFIR